MRKNFFSVGKLVLSVLACHSVGVLGSLATGPAIATWYAFLAKPWFTPPSWVFAPVWGLLYTLMGLAVYLVWRQGLSAAGVREALALFVCQLGLNGLWSLVFFGSRSIVGGLAVMVVLWAAVGLTMIKSFSVVRAAGFLLVPYVIWVSFALVLNVGLFVLNP